MALARICETGRTMLGGRKEERSMQRKRDKAWLRAGASRWAAAGFCGVALLAARPAAAEDWAAPITRAQEAASAAGVRLGAGITQFGDGLLSDAGRRGVAWGGKADVTVGLDGARLGLWEGLSVAAQFEQNYGRNTNNRGDGSILPVNTATGFPRLGSSNSGLSLTVTQRIGANASVTVGKFNMLNAVEATPLIGGGGRTTFWNLGLAAPLSGVTPPYVVGALLSLQTAPARFSLFVYDPRNAQANQVLRRPFAEAATVSLSATVPLDVAGLPGFHTLRLVGSSQRGTDFADIPQLLLPTASARVLGTRQGYFYGAYSFQQFLWTDPADRRRGWGLFGQAALSDGNPNPIRASALLGLGGNSPLPGRIEDRSGVGGFYYAFSRTLKDGLAALGSGLRDEYGVEAFYDAELARHLRLATSIQAIRPGTPGPPTAVFAGTRLRLVF
jgi:porin